MERPTNKELKKWGYVKVEVAAKNHHKTFIAGMKHASKILLDERKEFKKSTKSVAKFLSRERESLFAKQLKKVETKE